MLDCADHKLNLPFANGRFELHSLLLCFVVAMVSDRSYHLLARIYHSRSRGASCAGLSNFRFCAADTLQVPRHDLFKLVASMFYFCKSFQLRPGFLSPSAGLKFADIPNGLAAVSKVPVAGWAQIAAYFGFVEFSGGFDDYKTGTPGDYGFKVLTSSDPEEKTKKLSAELANGRLAMMAIIGMFFQDLEDQR